MPLAFILVKTKKENMCNLLAVIERCHYGGDNYGI